MPPLRDRPNDLPTLLANEIARASRRQGKRSSGSTGRPPIGCWPTPGRGTCASCPRSSTRRSRWRTGDVIGEEHLLLGGRLPTPAPRRAAAVDASGRRSLREAVHRHIASVLEDVGGNKRRAARELGVSRATLDRKLREMAKAARR